MRILSAALFLHLSFVAGASAATITKMVDGLGGRKCNAILFHPDEKTKLPLVFSRNGSGAYTMTDPEYLQQVENTLRQRKLFAALSVDRPGIEPEKEAKGDKFTLDKKVYFQHTQKDMVRCTVEALLWAQSLKYIDQKTILLSGHSEGAEIVVRAYKELLEKHAAAAKAIKAIVLSATPMQKWEEIFKFQNGGKDDPDFWKNVEKGDDEQTYKDFGTGSLYLREMRNTEPLSETLEALKKLEPKARFEFFHGLNDGNAPVTPVFDFDEKNQKAIGERQPHLDLVARYYAAAHGLGSHLGYYEDKISCYLKHVRDSEMHRVPTP